MKKITLVLASLAFATFANAEITMDDLNTLDITVYDANKDGKVTKAEFTAVKSPFTFEKIDADKNGVLTKTEIRERRSELDELIREGGGMGA